MTMLRIERLQLENFRCFSALDVAFEPDLTVLFAENGGGKSAVLAGLAMGLALLQPSHRRELSLDAERDVRQVRGTGEQREASGACQVTCVAEIGGQSGVTWSVRVSPTSGKRRTQLATVSDAIEKVRQRGERWPLLGHYGTGRFSSERATRAMGPQFQDRWAGYAGCLDASSSDRMLLDWLKAEAFGDLARHRRGEEERRLDKGVLDAMRRATPGVADLWYAPEKEGPAARFKDGSEAWWSELSDGYHVFLSLVGDIARRATILNGQDGPRAPELVEGVVLIDEIDLHLHPRWQREVLRGLKNAFPKLQFIVTTHSPQVLSSVKNRQVRKLVNWTVKPAFVEGRDTNAILREDMNTGDRDPQGKDILRKLYAFIDDGRFQEGRTYLAELRKRWGDLDPELIRAERLLEDAAAEGGQ